jgi:hypothetical protein
MECVMSTNLINSVCMPERDGDYTTDYKGGLDQMLLYCQCFTEDNPCQDNL